ncbi:L-serine ammonia-lyase, iron-sulfur-dependent, subunit alpha [Helicovermis profundi]|uniref:L-serine dehydratase n=1 Tax=Helicovermis profundi TaxID=3065157 RepID=A0AAU9EPE7_9FIRM|nr:L-serine ammonia-lyase, iron-sulfur-dependent, subunit alpha [Clostridia bacterium S502]
MKYNFSSGRELLEKCNKYNMKISEIMINREIELSFKTEKELKKIMLESVEVMIESSKKGIIGGEKSLSGLIGGEAKLLEKYRKEGNSLSGDSVMKSIISAMSVLEVNATMGKIVASPTAGSCGIIPGALVTTALEREVSKEKIVEAVFTSSAVGYLFLKNATVAGAEGGCQAETGTASAMAAAGLVELFGGSPKAALSAASFTIKNILGLVCDPIAGLVECPCQKRNALLSTNALISADMALAGIETIIPFDEVVEAMYKVGKMMSPSLKETAEGGMASTPSAKAISKKIFG